MDITKELEAIKAEIALLWLSSERQEVRLDKHSADLYDIRNILADRDASEIAEVWGKILNKGEIDNGKTTQE